jgi:hypothetical protein
MLVGSFEGGCCLGGGGGDETALASDAVLAVAASAIRTIRIAARARRRRDGDSIGRASMMGRRFPSAHAGVRCVS